MRSKLRSKLFFLILILFVAFIPIPFVRADWLAGWDQRVKITIDSGDIDGALTNFPVLLNISQTSGINDEDITFIFDEIGANSLKIAVTESDGSTECKVEIERWDLGNEKAWLWVKVPSIASGADTDIYFYYDNDHADNNANVGVPGSAPAEAVWDANFQAVYHLGEGAGVAVDSTDNDRDGTFQGDLPTQVDGQIGKAQDCEGSSAKDYVEVDPFESDLSGSLTILMWVKAESLSNSNDMPIAAHVESYNNYWFAVSSDTHAPFEVRAQLYDGANNPNVDSISVWPTGTWTFIGLIRDTGADTLGVIINGVIEDTVADSTTSAPAYKEVHIGAEEGGPVRWFDGVIDSVTISSTPRTASWIKATYETGRDDLLDFGEEEEKPIISPPYDPNLLFGAGFNASSPYVELHWNHSLLNVQFFEIQNSSDAISWDYLGQSTTTNYTDYEVVNGTARYYKVRACNYTDAWYNSSFLHPDFEIVYFNASANGGIIIEVIESDAPWIALAIILSIVAGLLFTSVRR